MTAAGATTYQWDGANRLKSVNGGTSGSYGFDGDGVRVKKTESGSTTFYVRSLLLGVVMEVASSGVQRAYVMNGKSVVAQRNADGNFYWLHQDHLGSGRKMTDTSGNLTYRAEFDPYGKLILEWSQGNVANRNSRKFTGYERDNGSGLDYAQARMYSSEWGRFLTPDPIGMASVDKLSPKTLIAYAYVNGNPVNATDPIGLGPLLPTNNGSDRPNPAFIATGGYAVCIGEIMRRLYYNYAAQFLNNVQGPTSSGGNQSSPRYQESPNKWVIRLANKLMAMPEQCKNFFFGSVSKANNESMLVRTSTLDIVDVYHQIQGPGIINDADKLLHSSGGLESPYNTWTFGKYWGTMPSDTIATVPFTPKHSGQELNSIILGELFFSSSAGGEWGGGTLEGFQDIILAHEYIAHIYLNQNDLAVRSWIGARGGKLHEFRNISASEQISYFLDDKCPSTE